MSSSFSFVEVAKKFNNFYLGADTEILPLIIDGHRVGLLTPRVVEELHKYPDLFTVYDGEVELNPKLDYEQRSNSVESLLKEWRKKDLFVTLRGWRDECFDVKPGSFDDASLMRMERSATCLFGIRQYGVSINGYVNHPSLGLCVWLQKRSLTKQTWPGFFDNMVGGGLSCGYTVLETALKEGEEEAGLGALRNRLVSVGSVSFFFKSERGLFPNTEFTFDLELPLDWDPKNGDGEVEEFKLVTAKEALRLIQSPTFKTTSIPVMLDFLIRHGQITVENEPELAQITELLHVPLHSIYNANN